MGKTMRAVVLFDGVCNLCNGTIDFIIHWDRDAYFRFASLQSAAGQRLVQGCNEVGGDSVVLLENERCFTRSSAVLRILRILGLPWSLTYGFIIIPSRWRDGVYDWVARHRYAWFGKQETCRLPTTAERQWFLD